MGEFKEPKIGNLPYEQRRRFFFVLVLIFLIALPALIFYTTGYRLNFDDDTRTIVTTGGMYLTTDNLDVEVYIDEAQVERPRLFRSAYYIQNVVAGMHRVVVQSPGLTTWVKELPVDQYLVVEAAAFNMPAVPTVRPITEYVTATGTSMYFGKTSTSTLFTGVTTSASIGYKKTLNSRLYERNQEYQYVKSLFATSSPSRQSVFERILNGVGKFGFATSTTADGAATSTEDFVDRGNLRLLEREGELYAMWTGSSAAIPYYFCVSDQSTSSIAKRYGEHVAVAVEYYAQSTTTPLIVDGNRLCRPEIRIDRKWQDIYFYDFLPQSPDLVLLQLQNGLYVTEIDDRSWQNTQLIYPGDNFQVAVENGIVYVKNGDYYFEVITKIEPEQ